MLKTNRGFWKTFFLSLITLGIYSLYLTHTMAKEANIVNPAGKRVPGLLALILLSIITLGIYGLVWNYRVCEKFAAVVAGAGRKPRIDGGGWLLWSLLGALILVGPLVAYVKQLHIWNDANSIYNYRLAAMYAQPQYGQPQYGQPQYGQPQYGQPQYGQPQYPQYQPPQYGQR